MAINKNFVIKNGVEVNTSLIVGDADLNKVGVGTTVPGYTLHVGGSRGGIGATDLTVTGIATVGTSGSTSAALSVVGVSSFQGDVNFLGSAGVSTITFDASLDKLNFADNARATFGADDDLQIFHDGSNSIIRETGTGNIVLEGSGETLAVFADDGAVSLYYDDTNVFQTTPQGVNVSGVTTSARLNVSGISTLDGGVVIGSATSIFANGNVAFAGLATANGGVQVGTAASIYTNGNIAAAGIVTANGGLAVGAAVTLAVNGNAAFAGIVTVGGDLKVTGDLEIAEDLVLDTNLNLLGIASISNLDNTGAGIGSLSVSGVSTFSGDLIVGVSTLFADVSAGRIGIGTAVPASTLDVDGALTVNSAKVEDLTNNRVVIAGTDGELEDSSNLTFDGSTLAVTGDETVSGKVSVGSGVTAFANGNLAVAGISTFNGNVLVGTGITIQPHGGVSIAGIVTVGGDLNVVGDITYDEIGGRNINITGFSTFGNDLNVGLTTFFVDVSNGGVGVGTDNPNPNGYGPQFKVFGNNPVLALEDDGGGVNAFGFVRQNSNILQIVTGDNSDNKIQISKTSDTSSSWTGSNLTNVVTIDQGNIGVGIATATLRDSSKLDVDGDARFSGKVAVRDGGNAGAGVTIFDNGNIVASGIITATEFSGPFSGSTGSFSGDLSIADKITHIGDTNTAIRFPAADTFTVETSGSERLRADSSGNIGINSTIPRSKLHAASGSSGYNPGNPTGLGAGAVASLESNTDVALQFLTSTTTDNFIYFGDTDSATTGSIQYDHNTNALSFNVNGGTERVRIDSSGGVGIATATIRDSAKLDVDGGARFSGSVIVKDGGNAGAGVTIFDNGNVAVSGIATIGGTLIVRGEATFTTHARWSDSDKAIFGAGDDLQIYHDGTDSFIDNSTNDLILRSTGDDVIIRAADDVIIQTASSENAIVCSDNGNVALYHNDVEVFQTTDSGIVLKATEGAGANLEIYADQGDDNADKFKFNVGDGGPFKLQNYAAGAWETSIEVNGNGNVELYYDNNKRLETTTDGVDISGTGSIKIPVGTTAQRNGSPTAGDFRYNSTLGQFEGYTDSWGEIGGSGGVSETDTSVSTTTATGVGSFAVATHRSAAIIAQIDQGGSYQVGRYLMIHDGTTATVIEESAIATGDMLGSFTADVNNSNAELKVTMNNSGIATVTTKIDTVTV